MVEIEAEILDERLEQEVGRADGEDEEQQQDRQRQVQLRQPAHALADAGRHRDRGRRHDHGDQADLNPGVVRDAQKVGQAAVHLRYAEAQ